MRYDRGFKRWVFSTDRIISQGEIDNLVYDYNEFRKKMFKTDIRDINHEIYGAPRQSEELSTGAKIRNALVAIFFIGAFICCILALVLKNILLFGILFSSFFFVAGGILAFTGETNPKDSASKKIRGRVMGIFIMLGSVAALSLILMRDRFSEGEFFVWLASAVFGLAGICIICIAILDKLSAKIIYKEEIDAKCIGYVRMADSDNDHEGPPMTYIYISPVFEYSYEGQRIEAIYDTLYIGSSSDIELDSYSKIRINPKHPEDILSPHVTKSTNFAFVLIFGILFALVGSGLAWYSLLGNTKDLTVETSWNNLIDLDEVTMPTKIQISDQMVEETYKDDINGKDWYSEITTITNVEDYEGNLLLTFDDTFEKMLVKAGTDLKTGDQVLLLYTVSLETPDQETAYKQAFVYGKTDTMEYTGTHKAFVK